MATVTCDVCNETIEYNENYDRLIETLTEFANNNGVLTNIRDDLKKLIKDIPEYYGKKDELGENVEKYIEELWKRIQEQIIDKESKAKNPLSENAKEKDYEIANALLAEHKSIHEKNNIEGE